MRTQHQSRRELDKIDRNILRILQADGRISFTELGERVGLSTTPCTERVRRLEREGIIMGYNARLNPQNLKASLLVFVEISLDYKSGDTFDEFRRAILKLHMCWSATWCRATSITWPRHAFRRWRRTASCSATSCSNCRTCASPRATS